MSDASPDRNPRRRDLSYAGFADIATDLDRLRAGHETVGTWTLGQVCRHLAATVRLTHQPAGSPPPEQVGPPRQFPKERFFAAAGRFPEGVPIPFPAIVPPAAEGLDDAAEVEALRTALADFAAAPGPLADHPILGPLTKDEWERFHCLHCAHHLSFARPA